MAVRTNWQLNAGLTLPRGGLILSNISDIKGHLASDYAKLPFMLDLSGADRLLLGDTVAGARSGISLPAIAAGGFGAGVRTVSASPASITPDDCIVFVDANGGNRTLNLPAAATMAGQILWIKRIDENAANAVTVVPNGAETIDLEASYVLSSRQTWSQIISTGASWKILQRQPRLNTLIDDVNPGATSTGAVQTIGSSASTFFWGRPVLVICDASMRNANGSNEFMHVDFYIQIDAGTNQRAHQWSSNLADNHQAAGGSVIITPTRGNHTINYRFQRLSGAGTATIDGNDYLRVTCVEL